MSYLTEAFKALDALNEDTFSVSDDGIKKLAEFEDSDDLVDEITVYDADAEDTEDLEDSYVGKVIVDCNVCHSKIYKDKSDVVIDEETQNANINEECPYCYSTDGFKVIGEVAPMTTETEEKVEVEDNIEESLNESTSMSRKQMINYLERRYSKRENADRIEAILSYLYGSDDFPDDDPKEGMWANFTDEQLRDAINSYEGYRKVESLNETSKSTIKSVNEDWSSGVILYFDTPLDKVEKAITEGKLHIPAYENGEWSSTSSIRVYGDDFASGYGRVDKDKNIFQFIYPTYDNEIRYVFDGGKTTLNRAIRTQDISFMRDAGLNTEVKVIKDAFAEAGVDVLNVKVTLRSPDGELITTLTESLIVDFTEDDIRESLNEATVTDYKGSLSNILVKNQDKISKMTTKGEIVKFLDSITNEVRDKNYLETVKRNMQKKNDFGALQYIYGIILSGEGRGVKESINENISDMSIEDVEAFTDEVKKRFPGSEAIYDGDTNTIKITLDKNNITEDIGKDIDEYQQWVDYDMKRYHKISDKTNDEIRKAGLQVVKDKYGDYQVIAGKYDESLKETLGRDIISMLDKRSIEVIDGVRYAYDYLTQKDLAEVKDIVLKLLRKEFPNSTFEVHSITLTYDELSMGVLKDDVDFNRGISIKLNRFDYSDNLNKVLNKYTPQLAHELIDEMKATIFDISMEESLKESVKDVTITTDDSKTTMTSDDEGKVTLTTEPVEQHKDDEVIEPLTDETEAEIESNDGEEDIDIEDFDEESFDELGEGYFKNVYENVNSFKASNITTKDNKVIVEGVITFDNNVKKNTSFLFESANKTKNGKYRFIGENLNVTKGNKAFSLIGNVTDKKFLSESMNYNYRTKNDIGKFIRCCGTIKRG